ncbi:MAG: carboxypeptidase-like regulatory domain-containing protein, partial [Ginsengibacter sp.]
MKLLTIFLLIGILQVNARGYAQEKFTFTMNDVPVKQIFREIEKKSDFTIFYRQDQVDLNRKVTIEAMNLSIDQIMDKILQGQEVTFKISGNIVILKPSLVAINESSGINISGNVLSTNSKLPIPGVTVMEKFTKNGTPTDSNGRFNIIVKDRNAVLVFHHIGYKEVEISVGEQTIINISMEEDNKILDQVVVVGYGTQKKKDITGSISVVSSKALEDRPNTEFGYSLEGKAAGVQVIRASGQPQAGFSIRIRGTSSITSGSEPLYIVDGVQTQSINEINPGDIESFSILKDA